MERRAVAAAPEAVDPEQHRRAREAYASTYAAFLNNDGVIDEKEAASLRVIAKNSDLSPEEVSAIEVEVQTSRSQEVVAVQTSQSQEVAANQGREADVGARLATTESAGVGATARVVLL